jgi:hypothetical protein
VTTETAEQLEIVDSIPLQKIQTAVDMDRIHAPSHPVQNVTINTNNILSIADAVGFNERDMSKVYDIERGQRVSKDPPGTFFFVYVSELTSSRLVIPCRSKQEQELIWKFLLKHMRRISYQRGDASKG